MFDERNDGKSEKLNKHTFEEIVEPAATREGRQGLSAFGEGTN